jgi:hypothetical protein
LKKKKNRAKLRNDEKVKDKIGIKKEIETENDEDEREIFTRSPFKPRLTLSFIDLPTGI